MVNTVCSRGHINGKHTDTYVIFNIACCRIVCMMCYVYERDIQALLVLFLPFMAINRLADHYCHWFSELSLSRINKSTTDYTFTHYVGSFTSPYQIEVTTGC